jgi:hypothetical protein
MLAGKDWKDFQSCFTIFYLFVQWWTPIAIPDLKNLFSLLADAMNSEQWTVYVL